MNMDNRVIPKEPFVSMEDDDMIICRCEEITKGEIRRAVYEGMHTVEELRRYIRNGMGLCQGKTCGRLVKRIVAAELNVPVQEVKSATVRNPMRPTEISILAKDGGNLDESV